VAAPGGGGAVQHYLPHRPEHTLKVARVRPRLASERREIEIDRERDREDIPGMGQKRELKNK
jgi:hypothetical protein